MARYVVLQNNHVEMLENRFTDAPVMGVLSHGRVGTVFLTRSAAQSAIRRTNAYAERNNLPWSRDYKIQRIEEL